MTSQNTLNRSLQRIPSSTPSIPSTPTPGGPFNSWGFLNNKSERPDRSRDDVKDRKRRAEDVWQYFRKPQDSEAKRDKGGQIANVLRRLRPNQKDIVYSYYYERP